MYLADVHRRKGTTTDGRAYLRLDWRPTRFQKGRAVASITILQLNDLHGYAEAHAELRRAHDGDFVCEPMGGLARIKTIFDHVRKENPADRKSTRLKSSH